LVVVTDDHVVAVGGRQDLKDLELRPTHVLEFIHQHVVVGLLRLGSEWLATHYGFPTVSQHVGKRESPVLPSTAFEVAVERKVVLVFVFGLPSDVSCIRREIGGIEVAVRKLLLPRSDLIDEVRCGDIEIGPVLASLCGEGLKGLAGKTMGRSVGTIS
jgi:hypothetical protein